MAKPSQALHDLGSEFFDAVKPAVFPQSKLRFVNHEALDFAGLSRLPEAELRNYFWGFQPFSQNLPQPLAMRYHGHQFQHYNPELGDGRGFTFAQFEINRILYEFGTKGSGTTPYSRSGDGRLTLKGAVREALCTEMLENRGVDTSKTVCIFETGEDLQRNDEPSPTRSAVLTRMSRGHIRFGNFQRAAFESKPKNVTALRDYSLRHFYPDAWIDDARERSEALFRAVVHKCTDLVASYMTAGFVHGVLNTDNMNISGESFDYGPYRFLPHTDPMFTAAYFDSQGLYAYGRQPAIFLWNLNQLAQCLAMADNGFDPAESLELFKNYFQEAMQRNTLKRLNLQSRGNDSDEKLVAAMFIFLEESKIPFEQAWFDLHSGLEPARLVRSPQYSFYHGNAYNNLTKVLEKYEPEDLSRFEHPAWSADKACDLLIDEIEAIWAPISEKDDWTLFENKIHEIRFFRGL